MKQKLIFYKVLGWVFFILAINSSSVFSQVCESGSCSGYLEQYPTFTLSTSSSSWSTAGTCFWGGDYAVFSVTAGNTYEWSTCNDFGGYQGAYFDVELTLYNSSWSALCFNDNSWRSDCPYAPYIGWTATYTGQVYVLVKNRYFGVCQNYTGDCATLRWRQSATGSSCSGWYTSPSSSSVPYSGSAANSFNVYVTSGSSCTSNIISNNTWINTLSASGSTVNFVVDPNSGSARTGTISVINPSTSAVLATYTVNQAAAPSTYVTASFGYSAGCTGNTTYFYDYSSGSPSPNSWYWTFGDGASSTSSSPNHAYTASGTYTATETVYNSAGNSNTTSHTFTISNPVSASFSPSAGFVSTPTYFSDNSVYNCGSPNSWSWNFGDGGTSTLQNPSHTYTSSGTFNVIFTACNNLGNCSTTSHSVSILSPSTITFLWATPSNNILSGQSVTLNANVTGSPDTYEWTISGGYVNYSSTMSGANPVIVLTNPGSYRVTLRVHNGAGWSATTTTASNFITVNSIVGVPVIPGTGSSYPVQLGFPALSLMEPVNIGTGTYGYRHTDLHVAAINSSLNFTRYYNSINNTLNSDLGYGWSHAYDYYVTNLNDSVWNVHYADGHVSPFVPLYQGGGSSFPLFGGTYEKLVRDTVTGIFTLVFKTGEVFVFNAIGKLSTITDLNSNVTSLSYTGSTLNMVTGTGGRKLVFTYTGPNITTVTDQLSRSIHYGYTGGDLTSASDGNGGITHFIYDGQHRIVKITTAAENVLLINTYDSQGRVIVQKDAFNDSSIVAYDIPSLGDATITYPDGSTTIAHNDQYCRLTRMVDQLLQTKSYAYDFNNNIDTFTDENSLVHTYTYDSLGNVSNLTLPTGTSLQFGFNNYCRPTNISAPLGRNEYLTYDGLGNLLNVDLPNSGSLQFAYNNRGQVDSFYDANGNLTTCTYNPVNGDLTSIHTASGTKTFTYDTVGRMKTYTDENHSTVTILYDGNDNVVSLTDAIGHSIIDSFDLDNNHVFSKDRNGNVSRYRFDAKDRLRTIFAPNGGTTTLEYDSLDNTSKITNANGHSLVFGHNAKKQLTSVTNSTGTRRFGYDPVGNLVSDTDATGNVRTYAYDSLNCLVTSVDPLGNNYRRTYDSLGELTGFRLPTGRTTTYYYSNIGLIDNVIDAAMHPSSVTYDKNGNPLVITDPNIHSQVRRYNSSNLLSSITDASSHLDSFLYDGVGHLVTELKPNGGTINKSYDSLNRLKHVTNTGGNDYDYTYDRNGNLISFHNNTGTSYCTYDSLNKLRTYVDMFNDTVRYTRDFLGQIRSIRYPGGHLVTYGYDQDERLSTVTDWQVHVTRYLYEPNGKLTTIINPYYDTCRYVYDSSGRLVSMTNVLGSRIVSRNLYDLTPNGERTKDSLKGKYPKHLANATFVYSHQPNDALSSDGTNAYTTDASGNLNTAGSIAYTFSVDNLLLSVGSVCNSYDAVTNRVKKRQGGNTTIYVNDLSGRLSQVLQERDSATNVVKANYIYGIGLIARIDDSGNILYYHFDAQHNVVALSNSLDTVTDTYTYEPFGKLVKHTGSSNQPFTFVGQYGVQMETPALYYMRARFYDAANQWFISPDPYPATLKDPQTLNRYVYVLNNPVSIFDPSGLNGNSDFGGKKIAASSPPSLAVSLIPVVGSELNSKYYFQNGNWFLGSVFFLSAVAEAIPVEGEVEDGGKGLFLAMLRKDVTESTVSTVSENTLYHYTSEEGYNAIMESGELMPSVGVKNARYGSGQYLTDIAPGQLSIGQTSRQLFGIPWNTTSLSHFIEIDVSGLNVVKNAPYNYLIPGIESLPIGDRIVNGGVSIFK